jgi:hypothetical protein
MTKSQEQKIAEFKAFAEIYWDLAGVHEYAPHSYPFLPEQYDRLDGVAYTELLPEFPLSEKFYFEWVLWFKARSWNWTNNEGDLLPRRVYWSVDPTTVASVQRHSFQRAWPYWEKILQIKIEGAKDGETPDESDLAAEGMRSTGSPSQIL